MMLYGFARCLEHCGAGGIHGAHGLRGFSALRLDVFLAPNR